MENETQSERERGEREGVKRREREKLSDSRRERAIRKDNGKEGKNVKIAGGGSEMVEMGRNDSWSKGEKKKMERWLEHREDALN